MTLLAGNTGGPGNVDGKGSLARFSSPVGIVTDDNGYVYVADTGNSVIRKISPSGEVTTFAGQSGQEGALDGIGAAARFSLPTGIARDRQGNLYIADNGNYTIRKITPAGLVTTIAGQANQQGFADGKGTSASFESPAGIAVDTANNLYVSDQGNNTIRKITPDGSVTTLAGTAGKVGHIDGTGTAARFNLPQGIAVDGVGDIYVADTGNDRIRKITALGEVSTLNQSGQDDAPASISSPSTGYAFPGASDIFIDKTGSIYLLCSSYNGGGIYRITSQGITTLLPKSYNSGNKDGDVDTARFSNIHRMTMDNAGNIYITDTGNSNVRKIDTSATVSTLAGPISSDEYADPSKNLISPFRLASDSSGNIYITHDIFHSSVIKIDKTGNASTITSELPQTDNSEFYFPNLDISIAIDFSDNIYVGKVGKIQRITPAESITTLAGGGPNIIGSMDGTGQDAQFGYLLGITVDRTGNVYGADSSGTIRKITPAGKVTTLAGKAWSPGYVDGTADEARFGLLFDIAVDSSNNLYVVEISSNSIRKITPAGVVSTFAGAADESGSRDGPASQARFKNPRGLAMDSKDNLYIADTGNHVIRKITKDGMVSTIVGQAGVAVVKPGPLPATLSSPTDVTITPDGRLVITAPQGLLQVSPIP